MTTQQDTAKHVLDGLSVLTALGTFMDFLPAIAALLSIVWTSMRIIEMVLGKPFNEIFKKKDDDAVNK